MKSYVFPGNIEEDIRKIASQPIPYMRTEYFSQLMKESERMLLSLINNPKGKVISYTASGTGAMDAVVQNYVSKFEKVLVIAGGSFGYRWQSICNYYNYNCELFEVPFAKDIDYKSLEDKIVDFKPSVLLCQHHETSSGQLFNLQQISEICSNNNVSLVVDAISSFLTDPLEMDKLNIDICIVSSQKGLNISPGLSFVFLSERLIDFNFSNKSYYFDFHENLKNLTRGQTPYSPATTLFMQLHARLERNIALGTDSIIDSVQKNALYFRSLCKENSWEILAETPSNCITGFLLNDKENKVFKTLLNKELEIMPGGMPGFYRVSHIGEQSFEDLDELAYNIKNIEL